MQKNTKTKKLHSKVQFLAESYLYPLIQFLVLKVWIFALVYYIYRPQAVGTTLTPKCSNLKLPVAPGRPVPLVVLQQ